MHRGRGARSTLAVPERRPREPRRDILIPRGDAPRPAVLPELRGDGVRGDDPAQATLRLLPVAPAPSCLVSRLITKPLYETLAERMLAALPAGGPGAATDRTDPTPPTLQKSK